MVGSYRHVVAMVTVTVAGTAASVARFRATGKEEMPAFASAATQANFHTPVQAKNLDTGATLNGSVGIPVDATGVFMYEINTNMIEWLGLDLTSITGAQFTIDVVAAGE